MGLQEGGIYEFGKSKYNPFLRQTVLLLAENEYRTNTQQSHELEKTSNL